MSKLFYSLFSLILLAKLAFGSSSFNPETDMTFYLRVGKNRSFSDFKSMTFETKESIKNSHFDPKKPTVFQIHGYWENINNEEHVKLSQ
jgi:hypothetical protein